MKIPEIPQDGNVIQYIQQNGKAAAADKSQIQAAVKKPVPEEDRVDLSTQSREMKKIHDTLALTPEVRAEVVAALKKLVESGQYKVNTEALADKMLKHFLWETSR